MGRPVSFALMPSAPPKPCAWPSCGALTLARYCPAHAGAADRERDPLRGTAAERGYDSWWRRQRARFLAAHPLCRHCLDAGRSTIATVVDHVIPHRGDRALFRDRANWQALCKLCHDAKTAGEVNARRRKAGGGQIPGGSSL